MILKTADIVRILWRLSPKQKHSFTGEDTGKWRRLILLWARRHKSRWAQDWIAVTVRGASARGLEEEGPWLTLPLPAPYIPIHWAGTIYYPPFLVALFFLSVHSHCPLLFIVDPKPYTKRTNWAVQGTTQPPKIPNSLERVSLPVVLITSTAVCIPTCTHYTYSCMYMLLHVYSVACWFWR